MLWDADGVLQHTAPDAWDDAVAVVGQFPGALTGAPIDEPGIRAAAGELSLDPDRIVAVWSRFDVLAPTVEVVAAVRAAGTACYLATNQDAYRAERMRTDPSYARLFDGAYYSCDLGYAKPSIEYFDHIVADLQCAPDQLLFLDDQPRNVSAARTAGLRAECWTHPDGIDRLRGILAGHGVLTSR